MAFKRYDGIYSKSLQEKFDNEMITCPFCGSNPHWLLDLKSGFTKGAVTCMCEKCGAKLYTESNMLGWDDNLRVVDVGSRNINNLAANGIYHIKTLGNIPTKDTNGNDVFAAPLNASVSSSSTYADTSATNVQNAAAAPIPAVAQIDGAEKSSHKSIWMMLGGAIIIVLIIALGIFFGLGGRDTFEENKKKKFAEDAAKQLIADTLKSPSTAIWNEVSYMENNDDGLYIIYVDVEAQNSFGAYIRGRYFVIIYNIDVKNETFFYNQLFYCTECSGKDDTYNLNLIKSLNNYNNKTNEDLDAPNEE